ncbi:autotransporter domain-containing protein [Achromobacter sp.]|uniref:autotransporter domain-containing protein n=1 Tax=Achromobacter sp. TaxID=134375 RepID=UPI0039C8B855
MLTKTGAGATTKGHDWLASLEVGKPIALGNSWQLEPQAQIIYRNLNLDDTTGLFMPTRCISHLSSPRTDGSPARPRIRRHWSSRSSPW